MLVALVVTVLSWFVRSPLATMPFGSEADEFIELFTVLVVSLAVEMLVPLTTGVKRDFTFSSCLRSARCRGISINYRLGGWPTSTNLSSHPSAAAASLAVDPSHPLPARGGRSSRRPDPASSRSFLCFRSVCGGHAPDHRSSAPAAADTAFYWISLEVMR